MPNVKPIPDNSSVVIPMLVCCDVSTEIDFCKTTFGAQELGRRPGPDGTELTHQHSRALCGEEFDRSLHRNYR